MSACARCTWHPDRDLEQTTREQLTDHAETASHPLCVICHRSLPDHEPQTCERCLTDARSLLSGVVTMWSELPRHLGRLSGQSAQPKVGGTGERALPGGAILALLAPGSTGTAARRLTALDQTKGLDGREHGPDNRADDTPSVAGVLTELEDDWRHTRGEPAAPLASSTSAAVRAASRYLEVHARWAANTHPAFNDCVQQLRELHVRLEQATGRRRTPVKAGADCFDCGGRLIRPVEEGLEVEDHFLCLKCGAVYDFARYRLALKAATEAASRVEIDGEPWATVEALAGSLGRSSNTLKAWQRNELVRAQSVGGVVFLSVNDAQQEHATRPVRQRTAS